MSPHVSPNVPRLVTSFNQAISVYDQHFTQNEKKNTASYDGIDIVAINQTTRGPCLALARTLLLLLSLSPYFAAKTLFEACLSRSCFK